jgi:hypothetical protein
MKIQQLSAVPISSLRGSIEGNDVDRPCLEHLERRFA